MGINMDKTVPNST